MLYKQETKSRSKSKNGGDVVKMSQQTDQINSRLDFYKQDGKLVIVDKIDSKAYMIDGKELDFDIPQNPLTNEDIFEERKAIKEGAKILGVPKKKAKEMHKHGKEIQKQLKEGTYEGKKKEEEDDFEDKKNLPKNKIKNIKIKSDTIMSEENKETEIKTDLIKDSKKEIDGQIVDTPAEGDDDDIEGKIKGDPYNETEKYTKKKADMEETFTMKEVQDLIEKTMKGTLEPLQKDLSEYRKDKDAKNTKEAKNILDLLQVEPYKLPLETIKDLTLEQLRTRKDVYDQLPMVQDFVSENKHITHEDVNKYAFDMESTRTDFRDEALQGALNGFKKDHGEERYKNDFGGVM